MKAKLFWVFYGVTALLLLGAVVVPLWHFLLMLRVYYFVDTSYRFWYRNHVLWSRHAVSLTIPFVAVLVAVWVGFLMMPFLRHLSLLKKRIM